MTERPYSRYTRERTWAALYSQHTNAGYALVPYSATNNSIALIRCQSSEEVQTMMRSLLEHAEECALYYGRKQTPEKAPTILARARHAVILARSSDYHYYRLSDHMELRLIVCGLHDSYVHLPVLEMRTNRRYSAREVAVSLVEPDFQHLRRTQFGHNILVGALVYRDAAAQAFKDTLPASTQRRIMKEVQDIQKTRYRGRPLAFLTDAERAEIGRKIGEGMRRSHAQRRA